MKRTNETETRPNNQTTLKIVAFLKRHRLIVCLLAVLFVCTFFVPAECVDYRYSGQEVYQYVRVEYSLYGYCVNVFPMYQASVEEAENLNKLLLFTGMDEVTDTVTERWTYYYGAMETFGIRAKGFRQDTLACRDGVIEKIKAKGYKADALL